MECQPLLSAEDEIGLGSKMSSCKVQISGGVHVRVLRGVVISYQITDSSNLIDDGHQGVGVVVRAVAAEAVEVVVDPAGSRKVGLSSLDGGEQFEMGVQRHVDLVIETYLHVSDVGGVYEKSNFYFLVFFFASLVC